MITLNLRGHHLNIIYNILKNNYNEESWRKMMNGFNYSNETLDNQLLIVKRIFNEDGLNIRLIAGKQDCFCTGCNKLNTPYCTITNQWDNELLNKYNLTENMIYDSKDLINILKNKTL